LDILFALVVLAVLSPVLLVLAILIKLESKGPLLFRQPRIGYKGETFTMLKFRSMVQGAAQMGSGQYSFAGDPRVTRIGRFIRLTSLDELPQFINVLKGDMSVIGPRPTLLTHPFPLDQYPPVARRRFDVRPGITGWAQINGRKEITWDQRFTYDLAYVDQMSFLFDARIAIRTVGKLLTMSDNVNTGKTA
jgi:lipopolysaccharide/colanic/teichoic acid biosynthesis glycosyltransferase